MYVYIICNIRFLAAEAFLFSIWNCPDFVVSECLTEQLQRDSQSWHFMCSKLKM